MSGRLSPLPVTEIDTVIRSTSSPRMLAISLTLSPAYAPSRIIARVRRYIRVDKSTDRCSSAIGRGRRLGNFGGVAISVGSSSRRLVRTSHRHHARMAPWYVALDHAGLARNLSTSTAVTVATAGSWRRPKPFQ